MRAHLVVISAPILHLFSRIGKRQEPVGVQVLRPEVTVEGLDVGVVGWSCSGPEIAPSLWRWPGHRHRTAKPVKRVIFRGMRTLFEG
jgi:hypothetical protein